MHAQIMSSKNNLRGYALLEILLAFSIAMIIIVSMISLGLAVVRSVTVSKATAEAGKVVQREASRIKLLRDVTTSSGTNTAWEVFRDDALFYCNSNNDPEVRCHITVDAGGNLSIMDVHNTSGSASSTVTYYFYVTPVSNDELRYTVKATWNVGQTVKSYQLEGLLTNWKEL